MQQPINYDRERWAQVQPWMAALLTDSPALPAKTCPVELAQDERVLPWLAYRLHETGLLEQLPSQQAEFRQALARWSSSHMFSEVELERLLRLADQAGIEFLAIKGHAVGRTLYPNPACRPTSDFDLLVRPRQVSAAQAMLREAGYKAFNRFVGLNWLAGQSYFQDKEGRSHFSVDLHWDITNRMYFRQRVSVDELFETAGTVACGKAQLQVPGMVENTVIACVHLAAFDPGLPVDLRWLLDIRLLMAALDDVEIERLVELAGRWHAVEACLVFGEMAAGLDDSGALDKVLAALRVAARDERMVEYDRSLGTRWFDLWGYWKRLPWIRGKIAMVGEAVRRGLGR